MRSPGPPIKILEAPVTEIVFRTLKDQAFKHELETTLGTLYLCFAVVGWQTEPWK